MKIKAQKYINEFENNRIEFLFINFDYFDGNSLIANILSDCSTIEIGEKIDGIFYNIISIRNGNDDYKLIWHEDVGNYIYSVTNEKKAIDKMQEMVNFIVEKLNCIIE